MLTPLSLKDYLLGRDFRFLILVTFLWNETRRLFVKHDFFVKRITYVCFGHAVT